MSVNTAGFGSLSNAIYAQSNQVEPAVGMGATMLSWSDRSPATITRVSENKKLVWVRPDRYKIVSGSVQNGTAQYEFESDPTAAGRCYTLRRNGRWVMKGEPMQDGPALMVGVRDRYFDPHF